MRNLLRDYLDTNTNKGFKIYEEDEKLIIENEKKEELILDVKQEFNLYLFLQERLNKKVYKKIIEND
jgi:hypothetical protein